MEPTSPAKTAPPRPAKAAAEHVGEQLGLDEVDARCASATSSSSRMAIHERPRREPRRRQATKATTTAQTRAM